MTEPELPRLPLFAGLTPEQRVAVCEGMTTINLATGEALFVQGDPGTRFFLLLDGRLKVSQVTEDGRQIIVRIVNAGELCGFVAALGRDTYPGSAEAIVDTHLLAWPRQRWGAVIGAAPSLSMSAIEAVGRKLDEAHTRLREMSTEEAGPRIAHLLLRLAKNSGRPQKDQDGAVEIPFPLPRQDVADMTGTTLHTVSRIMAGWEAQGVLLRARRKVVIADMSALQGIAEPS